MKVTQRRIVAMTALGLAAAFAVADTVQVNVNGTPVQFEGARPQTIGGRVLVPLRGVFEQMGADVEWDEATQTVFANGGGRHIKLRIGSMDANVNDRTVSMDVAPQLIEGSTMVPLRFLGESLGAKVDWQPENNLVAITTRTRRGDSAPQRIAPPPPVVINPPPIIIREDPRPAPSQLDRPYVFTRDTVIPLRLDEEITSNNSRNGDKITASVRGDSDRYLDFPAGTVVEGVVRSANPASGSHAGTLDIRFTHIRFPDGTRYKVGGFVTRLEDKNIVRTDSGRFVARFGADNNVARDAGIGAGAGLLLGSFRGRAVGGAVVGGAVGAIVGIFDNHLAHNVILEQGMRLGLVLSHDLTIDRKDLRD